MSNITIYTKDYCPYCVKAKSLLTMKKIRFNEINLNNNPEQFEEMVNKSNGARTVPLNFLIKITTLVIATLSIN